MKIKNVKDEDFINYSKPSMFIIFPNCTFKCDKENGCNLCQNSHLAQEPTIDIDYDKLIDRYIGNPLTKAMVFGGLEPLDSYWDVLTLVSILRAERNCDDDIVIYTGYTEDEINDPNNMFHAACRQLKKYNNIIIKFGRFRPNEQAHLDEVLGVELASNNQYAKRWH